MITAGGWIVGIAMAAIVLCEPQFRALLCMIGMILIGLFAIGYGAHVETQDRAVCLAAGLEWRDGDCVRSEKEEPK